MCIYIYIHTYMYIYIYICVCVYIYIYIYIHIQVHIHINLSLSLYPTHRKTNDRARHRQGLMVTPSPSKTLKDQCALARRLFIASVKRRA